MRTTTRTTRPGGMAAMEVVFATGIGLPVAAFLYFMIEKSLSNYHFFIANTIGSPLL